MTEADLLNHIQEFCEEEGYRVAKAEVTQTDGRASNAIVVSTHTQHFAVIVREVPASGHPGPHASEESS